MLENNTAQVKSSLNMIGLCRSSESGKKTSQQQKDLEKQGWK